MNIDSVLHVGRAVGSVQLAAVFESDPLGEAVAIAPQGAGERPYPDVRADSMSMGLQTVQAKVDQVLQVLFRDPTVLMALAQSQMQRAGNAVGAAQVADAGSRQRAAEQAFQAASKAVEKLAKQHRSLFHRFKWLKPLIKAVAVVVAVAATVVSFGSAGPFAVAGLVLMFGAEYITKGLVAAGIVPKDKAIWVTMSLKLVGAALSLGAGLAGGAGEVAATGADAASTAAVTTSSALESAQAVADTASTAVEATSTLLESAQAVADTASTAVEATSTLLESAQAVAGVVSDIGEIVQDVLSAVQAGVEIDGAFIQRALERQQATAVAERDRAGEAGEEVEDGIDILRATQRQHARMMERIVQTQEIQERAGEASVMALPV